MRRQNRDSHVPGIWALRKSNYVYLNIPKNGFITHQKFFNERGWNEEPVWSVHEDMVSTDVTIIAHIRNPIERYIRGIVQSLLGENKDISFLEKMEDDPTALFCILTSVNDQHTTPISLMIPSSISPYQINWIPMDHPKWSANFLLNQLFRELSLPYVIGEEDVIHKADSKAKRMQDFVRKKMLNPDGTLRKEFHKFRSAILSEDFNIYNHVMHRYCARENYYTELFER